MEHPEITEREKWGVPEAPRDEPQMCSCGLVTDDLQEAVCNHAVCDDCKIVCEECGELVCPNCIMKDSEGNKLCSDECKTESEQQIEDMAAK